ncbi:hepatoma-derived growth factor-related protein 2-like [Toxorhynchites rutilus septentrionalis]|uniref:hepatoma-derived growth factor-related protein 2-like n=1 Tax=Toxorhynchites rutilus septentrionalis TaxID=329112 RepID=UPI00247A1267|nr:hepatoma-derived growth factor-related protein 2-like [Toxorhynchites rutilus septentrionalis]
MVASKKSFKIGDLVFAKVKGYPPWPAKITKIEKSKYNVYFYGTGETANIKLEDLFAYPETKEKYATEKIMKRKGFKEAILQIESALNGEDPSPITLGSGPTPSSTNNDGKAEEAVQSTEVSFNASRISANSTVIDQSIQPEKEETRNGEETRNESNLTTKPAKDENQKQPRKAQPAVVDNNNSSSAPTNNKKSSTDVTSEEKPIKESTQTLSGSPVKEQPEVTSRSGRKIKPKRFLDNEEDDSTAAPSPAKKRAITPKEKTVSPAVPPKKPNYFEKIEGERVYFLRLERELVELNLDIKSCVGLAKADPEKCVELMDRYQKLKVTPTMLKKNPNCVETMKRLRKYVGNAKAWKMVDEERIKFDFQAQQIRTKAEQIYNQFKTMFPVPDGTVPFWEAFCEDVNKFEQATKHLSQEELFLLVDEADIDSYREENGNNTENKFEAEDRNKADTITAKMSNDNSVAT